MKQQLEQRLQSLKSEFESGQKMLADLEAKQANLRDTLLRISGAIQVLEEELNNAPEVADDNNQPPETVSAEVVTTAGDPSL
jgi:predicted  nucleic acid-binding Zn-ribbon protein